MGKKGRKTRWRKLPIPIGNGGRTGAGAGAGAVWEETEQAETKRQHHQPQPVSPSTFNEDEYTKITTPRQDMLFKKGYLGKKKTVIPPQDTTDSLSAGDSVESENYGCEEAGNPYMYPGGYVDPSGVYYVNNGYEIYDPYTGAVTVIVGPGPQFGNGHQVLAAVPCSPIPLQPLEWFNPSAPQPPFSHPLSYSNGKKRNSIDSQNCSGPSSETNCIPGSPPESVENGIDAHPPALYPAQYVYPGAYMFGAPLYNMNGVSVQGLVPQCAPLPPADQTKRRKKRRRRRRGGAATDEGSESSCEEVLSCEAGNEVQSGASSDTAAGSSSSKTNSDSGIHTDPMANSGSDSPQILESSDYYPVIAPDNLVEVSIGERHSQKDSDEVVSDDIIVNDNVHELATNNEVIEASLERRCDSPNTLEESMVSLRVNDCPEDEQVLESSSHSVLPEVLVDENCGATVDDKAFDSAQYSLDTTDDHSATDQNDLNAFNVPTEETDVGETSEKESEEEMPTSPATSTPPNTPLSPDDYYSSDETEPAITRLCDALLNNSNSTETHLANEPVEEDKSESNDVEIKSVETNVEVNDTIKIEEYHLGVEVEVSSEHTEELTVINNDNNVDSLDIEASRTETCSDDKSVRPITEAVTKWLEKQGSLALTNNSIVVESEDEGIEEGEDLLTGQKNGEGNPFLASSPSDSGTRVAEHSSTCSTSSRLDWDHMDGEAIRVRTMCDPKASVDKYYRLAADSTSHLDKKSSKTAGTKNTVHIGRTGPFPCGVCCILQ